jgi:hypothetical protein
MRARFALMVSAAALLLFGPAKAFAAGKGAPKHKPAAHAAAPARKPAAASTAKERTPSAATAPETKRDNAGSSGGGSDEGGGDDSAGGGDAPATTTAGTGGKKVTSKTYTFGAMDVEGKLKTPQLLYFLNRVKLELDMSAPDKRSFMKELQQSADDKNL